MHVVVALTQRTDLGGRVLKQITKHHPHFTRLRRELDFKKAVKYTLKPNTKVFAELHASRDFEHYFRGVMDNFLRRRAERMQPLCVARGWKNVYAIDYLNWCRIIGRTQDFPEVLRLTTLSKLISCRCNQYCASTMLAGGCMGRGLYSPPPRGGDSLEDPTSGICSR